MKEEEKYLSQQWEEMLHWISLVLTKSHVQPWPITVARRMCSLIGQVWVKVTYLRLGWGQPGSTGYECGDCLNHLLSPSLAREGFLTWGFKDGQHRTHDLWHRTDETVSSRVQSQSQEGGHCMAHRAMWGLHSGIAWAREVNPGFHGKMWSACLNKFVGQKPGPWDKQKLCLVPVWQGDLCLGGLCTTAEQGGELETRPFAALLVLPDVHPAYTTGP